ncbi:mobilization protein [Ruegeria lacuscaerulensis]|uniref:mobilization protein n=1 Tax=Ruegeria lacuscaerulensis TaxID=55218 RepID=UPI00147F7E9C|nr:mobilization protein [Ruegeria lacuscaerulensis]
MTTQLERAQKQFEQAKARLQKARSRETDKRRKKETRAKILLGGWMLAQAKADPRSAQRLRDIIAGFSERDRACFDDLDVLKPEGGHE